MARTRQRAGFDRVRPREARPRDPQARPVASIDPEGKRALFSAAAPVSDRPGAGSVVIECSDCLARSVVSPLQAFRAAFPSVVLGVTLVHGETRRTLGAPGQSAWLRCPACRRRRWVRLLLTV